MADRSVRCVTTPGQPATITLIGLYRLLG